MNVTQIAYEFSGKTLAQLYDPDKMPDGLREAHHSLDLAVERCYYSKPFTTDAKTPGIPIQTIRKNDSRGG